YSHTHTHSNMRNLTEKQMEDECRISKEILYNNGFDVQGFIYPFNDHDAITRGVVAKYFDFAFVAYPSNVASTGKNYPKINNEAIARVPFGHKDTPRKYDGFQYFDNTLEYYKERVDNAITNNNWLVFNIHSWGNSLTPVQQQHLKDLIGYINLKGVDIVSPSEGFDIYGNMIQTQNLVVDADSKVEMKELKVVYDGHNNKVMTDPVTSYPKDVKSYVSIDRAYATSEGLPGRSEGVLITDRTSFPNYTVKQTFEISPANSRVGRYERYTRWANSDWTWGDWVSNGSFIEFDKTTDLFEISANSTKDVSI